MSFFSREQRYQILCQIKHGQRTGELLTEEEEQFIRDYARAQVLVLMEDPECQAAMDQLYESRWAHRFD